VCDARSARTLAEQRAARECVAEARRASEAQLNIAVARVNGVVEVAAVVR
jgi:UrcA family protein